MLSRIANNLFWMGRYLERADHIIRYTKTNYFSALDAPNTFKKEFALESILRMSGRELADGEFTEPNVLQGVTFEKENANSVLNNITYARENARGARDIISTELWESINKLFHFVSNYDQNAYRTSKLWDFSQAATEQLTIIKGQLDGTLIHNDTWTIIKLGLYLERATQILRVIRIKWEDLEKLDAFELNNFPLLSHQIGTLLRGLESFDMSRKHYRSAANVNSTLEFILLNDRFPKSLLSCLHKVMDHIEEINVGKELDRGQALFVANKSYWTLKHTSIEEILEDLPAFLSHYEKEIYTISERLNKEYFSF